jgi:hypothetical protein
MWRRLQRKERDSYWLFRAKSGDDIRPERLAGGQDAGQNSCTLT